MRRTIATALAVLLAACTQRPPGRCTSTAECLAGQECRDGLCRAPTVGGDVLPPVVTARSPAPDAVNVPVSAVVTVAFSEPVARDSVSGGTMWIERTVGDPVAATIVISSTDDGVTIVPVAALAHATRYTVFVTRNVTDRARNPLAAEESWSFTTEPAPDAVAPTVSSRAPAPGATDVPVGVTVQVVLSEPLDPATVTLSTVLLQDAVGTPVIAAVSLSGATIALEPGAPLAYAAAYTVRLTTAIADLAGNRLAAEEIWSFSTVAPPDVTPPEVQSVSPAPDATGVPVGAQVQVVFGEAVRAASVDAASFRLLDPQGLAVAGTRTVSGATATLVPAAALASGSTYTASVSTAVTDVAGNALPAPFAWSFTTACPGGRIACGGACVDPTSDAANCGGCGTACGADQLCRASACVAGPCPGGRIALAGRAPIALTGDGPEAIAAADLDGDGHADLVVAETQQASIGVLRGNGDGTFAPRVGYAVGSTPRGLVLADLDRDGILDVAVAAYGSSAVDVLLGNGDGTFPAVVTAYATASSPRGIVAADLDGDGNPDLAVAAEGANAVSVLLGNGDGTFRPRTDVRTGSRPWGVVAADLNEDGRMDLAVTNATSTSVSVLLGNGDGTFAPRVDLPAPTTPHAIVAADLDGDGHLDLAVTSLGDVAWFHGNGDGTFRPWVYTWAACSTEGLAVGSVDGDLTPDLVTGGSGGYMLGEVCAVRSNGDGTFTARPSQPTGGDLTALVLVDVDGDGTLDVATANRTSDTITVHRGLGDGTFAPWVPVLPGSSPDQIVATDLDRDGTLDLVVSDALGGSTLGVYPGTAPGLFGARFDVESAASTDPTRVAVGDLNGDGIPDLVYVDYYPGALVALLGDGAGGFGSRVEYATTPNPVDLALGDLDGDGHLDAVVVAFSLNAHDVFLGKGDGTFAPRTSYPGSGYGVALADLDRDGVLDVATTSARGGVIRVQRGNGDGTLAAAVTYPAGTNSNRILAADLDGDGDVDLAETNADDSTVGVLLNRGDGTFAPRVDYPVGFVAEMIAAADLDGDGFTDLAVAVSSRSAVAVLRGVGDGTFRPAEWYEAGASYPRALRAVDLDRDGRPDLLVGGSQGVGVLRTSCRP